MSTYIGLRCVACDKSTGCGARLSWMEYLVQISKSAAPHVKALRGLGVDEIKWYAWEDWVANDDEETTLCDFLIAHEGHELHVYDEYGYDYDEAGERIEGSVT